MSADDTPSKPKLPSIRPADVLVVALTLVNLIGTYQKDGFRLEQVEKGLATQVIERKQADDEIRAKIETISERMWVELKDQGVAIRRIEDKINRARL